MQVGMGDDHSILNYLHAIRAARVGLSAGCADEAQRSLNSTSGQEESMWTPFGSSLTCCQVCELDFTWASTSSSAAQRLMDMHHCRRYYTACILPSSFSSSSFSLTPICILDFNSWQANSSLPYSLNPFGVAHNFSSYSESSRIKQTLHLLSSYPA